MDRRICCPGVLFILNVKARSYALHESRSRLPSQENQSVPCSFYMSEPIWPALSEQLTPYKLALGILLHAYVPTKDHVCEECLREAEQLSEVNVSSSFDVYANFAILFVKMLRGVDNRSLRKEPSLADIMSQLESQLKLGNYGAMYSKFLELRLSRVESPDDLLDLLSSFSRLLHQEDDEDDDMSSLSPNRPPHIAPQSIFGIFLRRIVLASNAICLTMWLSCTVK